MKFHCDLPWGGHLHYEREPMSWERFQYICWLIGIYIVGSGLIKFFALSV